MQISLKFSMLILSGAIVTMASGSVSADKGKELYIANCVACHGEKGDGKGPAGEAVGARDFTSLKNFTQGSTQKAVEASITNGSKANPVMVGFPQIKGKDLEALAKYVLSFSKK
jgi:mono/diheme cytochrome c family protein